MNSDEFLSEGILKLINCKLCNLSELSYSGFGNYLISHLEKPYYVGEARDVKKRIKQQFKSATSTFYKNFQKSLKVNQALRPITIEDFSFRYMPTEIGRKEIEDFGISNLSTSLNRFQIGKRQKSDFKIDNGIWDEVQKKKIEILTEGEKLIFDNKFLPWRNCNSISTPGLYIVKHRNVIIYIGESSDINERYTTHSSRTYFSALRRHIGTELLKYELIERNGKKKYFIDSHDKSVTDFLNETTAIFYPVHFGRYEFEEFLIRKYRPLLNRKDNKNE